MENYFGWWIYTSLCTWHCYKMCGWVTTKVLPSYIYILGRLPGEVYSPLWIRFRVSHIFDRIILASIRNLGACPCPRCLIPLSDAHKFGMALDQKKRCSLARTDDQKRQLKVSNARKLIYCNNYAVNSAPVEQLLKETSLVPTAVGVINPSFLNQS